MHILGNPVPAAGAWVGSRCTCPSLQSPSSAGHPICCAFNVLHLKSLEADVTLGEDRASYATCPVPPCSQAAAACAGMQLAVDEVMSAAKLTSLAACRVDRLLMHSSAHGRPMRSWQRVPCSLTLCWLIAAFPLGEAALSLVLKQALHQMHAVESSAAGQVENYRCPSTSGLLLHLSGH